MVGKVWGVFVSCWLIGCNKVNILIGNCEFKYFFLNVFYYFVNLNNL